MGGLCGGAPRLNRFCQKAAGRQPQIVEKLKSVSVGGQSPA